MKRLFPCESLSGRFWNCGSCWRRGQQGEGDLALRREKCSRKRCLGTRRDRLERASRSRGAAVEVLWLNAQQQREERAEPGAAGARGGWGFGVSLGLGAPCLLPAQTTLSQRV